MKIEDLIKDSFSELSKDNVNNDSVFSDELRERIYSRIKGKMASRQNISESDDSVSCAEKYRKPVLRRVLDISASIAAVAVISLSSLFIYRNSNDTIDNNYQKEQFSTTSDVLRNTETNTTSVVKTTSYTIASTNTTTTSISTSTSRIETQIDVTSDGIETSQTSEDSAYNEYTQPINNEDPDFVPYEVFIKKDVIAQTVPAVNTKNAYYFSGDLVMIYELKDDMARISQDEVQPEMWVHISDTSEIINLEAKLKRDTKIRAIIFDNDTKKKIFTKTEDKSKNDIVTIYFISDKWAKISIYNNEWLQVSDLEILD
jgi:hypothetical protein